MCEQRGVDIGTQLIFCGANGKYTYTRVWETSVSVFNWKCSQIPLSFRKVISVFFLFEDPKPLIIWDIYDPKTLTNWEN